MNKLLLTTLLLLVTQFATAGEQLIDEARADIGSARAEMIEIAMELTPEQGALFWPIYKEYAAEQDALLVKRVDMLKEFAENYTHMNEAHANSIAAQHFSMERSRMERRERYFARISKALGPILAARFIQVDNQVSTLLDFELMQATPLFAPVNPEEVEVLD